MRPRREASHSREIFKIELVWDIEGSLYGAWVTLSLEDSFITDCETTSSPQPEAHIPQASDPASRARRPAAMEAASQESLLGDEEVIYTNPQARGSNGASASRPAEARPQQNPQPVHRMPLVIRRLPSPPPNLNIPEDAEDFTFKFLLSNLRGTFQPPGCYHVMKQTQLQVYPVKAWYAIDSDEEPFMPSRPGQHGAKLTLVMPEESDADEYDPKEAFPFFVTRGSRGYVYYGTYRQPRYSDRLSYAEMELEVPSSVKVHRAKEVGRKDKPKWMVEALKWERVVATDKEAQAFGPVDILKAFQRADTDLGLRLYWEYFECMGYDRNLYDALVARKRSSE